MQAILNNGNINYSISDNSTDLTLKGFNLVGNPYPSVIDWSASSGWTRSDLQLSGGGYDIWIWNPSANNYGVFNSSDASGTGTNSASRYLAPMQGFFVLAGENGTLGNDKFGENCQSVSYLAKRKRGVGKREGNVEIFSLNVSSEKGLGSDEIQLRFGYDSNENGSMKLFSRGTKCTKSLSIFKWIKPLNISLHRYL